MNSNNFKKFGGWVASIVGVLLLPLIWLYLHYVVGVGERFLPSPVRVYEALFAIHPSILVHMFDTITRFVIGSLLGVVVGILIGFVLHRWTIARRLLLPTVQALRATPPVAVVPFFLLWFGFSDVGRYLLIVFGLGVSLAITTFQILENPPEKYRVLFKSFSLNPRAQTFSFSLPYVLQEILPTIRFCLAVAIGLVVVSEFLGSQTGLGYLIQTSRATFSLHVIFLANILLGVILVVVDWLTIKAWSKLLFWQRHD
jgi:ABC-type nitrate/sulfonate/bicarbonate transport system permease component